MDYTKEWLNTDFYVIREHRGGVSRVISEQQHDYQEWLDKGNTPIVMGYVVPPEPPEHVPSLEEAKAAALTRINHGKWMELNGSIDYYGHPLATDDRSRTLMTGLAVSCSIDPTTTATWHFIDGTTLDLDANDIISMGMLVMNHVEACFAREAELVAHINTLTEVADVEAITWESEV